MLGPPTRCTYTVSSDEDRYTDSDGDDDDNGNSSGSDDIPPPHQTRNREPAVYAPNTPSLDPSANPANELVNLLYPPRS